MSVLNILSYLHRCVNFIHYIDCTDPDVVVDGY